MRSALLVGLFLSSIIGTALAQPGAGEPTPPPPPPSEPAPPPAEPPPPPPPEPMPAVQPPPAPPTTVEPGIVQDANSGRGWLMPTALTAPAGTWSFTDFELFVAGVSYSPTDNFQLSAFTLLPIVENMPLVLLASAKAKLLKAGNVHVALQGALNFVSDSGDSVTAGELGGALTLCIDDACHSHVSGFLGAGFAHESQSAVPFLLAGSAAFRVANHLKLIFEADTGFIAGDIDAFANGFLFWYGARFTSSYLGVDLGFAKLICTDSDVDCSDGLPMGFPFVSFSYRNLNE